MSFSSIVKQEVSQKIMEGNDARAELSALIQMCSSLSFSNRGMTILVTVENAAVARVIYRMVNLFCTDRENPSESKEPVK